MAGRSCLLLVGPLEISSRPQRSKAPWIKFQIPSHQTGPPRWNGLIQTQLFKTNRSGESNHVRNSVTETRSTLGRAAGTIGKAIVEIPSLVRESPSTTRMLWSRSSHSGLGRRSTVSEGLEATNDSVTVGHPETTLEPRHNAPCFPLAETTPAATSAKHPERFEFSSLKVHTAAEASREAMVLETAFAGHGFIHPNHDSEWCWIKGRFHPANQSQPQCPRDQGSTPRC